MLILGKRMFEASFINKEIDIEYSLLEALGAVFGSLPSLYEATKTLIIHSIMVLPVQDGLIE